MRQAAFDFAFDALEPSSAPIELTDQSERCVGPTPSEPAADGSPDAEGGAAASARASSTAQGHIAQRCLITDETLRPGNLADCFALVATHPDVPDPIRNLAQGGERLVAAATGRAAADLPADPVALRPFLRKCRRKSFASNRDATNFAHLLKTVLTLTGWLDLADSVRRVASTPWQTLLETSSRFGKRNALAPFLRHCDRMGLLPGDVSSATLLDYVEFLERWTLDPSPWSTVLSVRRTWEYMRGHYPGWPGGEVDLPRRRRSEYATRIDLCVEEVVGGGGLANRSLVRDGETPPGNLGACFDFVVSHPEVTPLTRREVLSARRMLARSIGQDLGSLPTDPQLLRPVLNALEPFRIKCSKKRYQNVVSATRSVLILSGHLSADYRKRQPVGGAWAALLFSAKEHSLDQPLVPFFRFCERHGASPETMTADILDHYVDWLTTKTLNPKPRNAALCVRSAWDRMRQLDPTWPQTTLVFELRSVVKFRTDFTSAFHVDLSNYLNSLREPHPRDPTYGRPLARKSIDATRTGILRAATFLTQSGTLASEITGIAALVTPDRFERILLTAHEDAGGRWTDLARQISITPLMAARRWVKLDATALTDVESQVRSVRVIRSGRRRRDELAQFATLEARADLYDLPRLTFEQAESLLKKGIEANRAVLIRKAARLHEIGLVLAILLTQPIRIGNLAALDLRRHVRVDRAGRPCRFLIEAGEVKNTVTIEIFIPDFLQEKLVRHLETFWPRLLECRESTALFPNKHGRPLKGASIGIRLRKLAERQLGVRLTAHLLRHLAAEALLNADPNNLYLAQRFLGHGRPETTARIYAHPRTGAAQRIYAELIERDLKTAGKPRNRSRRSK